MRLTEEQQSIVNLNQGQHLVLAPPGTGKTELLAHGLMCANNNGVSQDTMICLTFTNRAAINMVERVKREIGEHSIFIGNIHSFCSEFLKKHEVIPQNATLLDEGDVALILEEIRKEYIIELQTQFHHDIKISEVWALGKINACFKQEVLKFPQSLLPQIDLGNADIKQCI